MYYSLRAAARISRGTVGAVAAPGCVVSSRGRSVSSTSAACAGMEQPKHPQQQAVSGEDTRNGAHKAHWDPMAHSFGEGYSTRADDEGFGMVYARGDDEDRPGHPEYDTSQGCEVKEKERQLKDDKHAT